MKRIRMLLTAVLCGLALCACTQGQSETAVGEDFRKMEKTGSMELSYATQFSVDEYENYRMVHIEKSGDYLIVPEGQGVPTHLPKDTVVLKKPLDKTYLVATAAMDPVAKIDALSSIRLTGTKAKDWEIPEAKEAMEKKKLLFAGKYSQPDYELILSEGCNLALENTMIFHNPSTKEKLEELGIPVLVECSSYEEHPLGRMEWMKLYGLLFDREKEATAFFDKEVKKLDPILEKEKSGKSVAFFYITTDGTVNVRKPGDYISRMIEMAGGEYCIKNISGMEENALSTAGMQMEDFYAAAKDADVLIYNSTIVGELSKMKDLIQKNKLFADFKAVKDGQVFCTNQNFYQETTGTCSFIEDLHAVFQGNSKDMKFLRPLQ